MFALGAEEALRIAAEVAADPERAVSRWKALTGRKAVGIFRGPVPEEVLHAAGMLPVCFRGDEDAALGSAVDAWVVPGPRRVPGGDLHANPPFPAGARPLFRFPLPECGDDPSSSMVALLDRVEEFSAWAEDVSGKRVTEGALERAVRTYNENRSAFGRLEERMAKSPGAFTGLEFLQLVDAGMVLPKEAHSALLRGAPGRTRTAVMRRPPRAKVLLAGEMATMAVMKALDAANAGIAGDDLARGHRYFAGRVGQEGDLALSLALRLRESVSALPPPYGSADRGERLFHRAAECGADHILMVRDRAAASERDEAQEIAARAAERGVAFLCAEAGFAAQEPAGLSERILAFLESRP